MNIEANTKTTTTYLVIQYGDRDDHTIETYSDLASARAVASQAAMNHPGEEFHVAAHMTTFRAEITVKEV